MIDRYSRKELKKIWEEKNKYQIWLNIEIAATQAMENLGLVPKGVAKKVKRKATINVERIHKIENKVHHDIIAFLTSISEKVGPEGRFLHKGMTSSDVLDTCFNIQLVEAGKIILKDIMPSEIKNFQSTEMTCSFEMQGMPKLELEITKKIKFSKISLTAIKSQIPFTLDCVIKENGEQCQARLEINIELNMMMRMMVEKPLTQFLDILASKMQKL